MAQPQYARRGGVPGEVAAKSCGAPGEVAAKSRGAPGEVTARSRGVPSHPARRHRRPGPVSETGFPSFKAPRICLTVGHSLSALRLDRGRVRSAQRLRASGCVRLRLRAELL